MPLPLEFISNPFYFLYKRFGGNFPKLCFFPLSSFKLLFIIIFLITFLTTAASTANKFLTNFDRFGRSSAVRTPFPLNLLLSYRQLPEYL